jgi:hypothetical protein
MTVLYGVGMTKAPEATEVEVSVTLIGDYYAMRVCVGVPGPIDEDDDETWKEVALKAAIDLMVDYYGWKNLESTVTDVDFEIQSL